MFPSRPSCPIESLRAPPPLRFCIPHIECALVPCACRGIMLGPKAGYLTCAVPATAAAWYAEFLHHMSVQQPVNMLPYCAAWPWNYQYAHSQMAAQAMGAAAMGIRAAPGLKASFCKSVSLSCCVVVSRMQVDTLCRSATVRRG